MRSEAGEPSGIEAIGLAAKSAAALMVLDLSGNPIDEHDAAVLGRLLRTHTALQRLRLRWTTLVCVAVSPAVSGVVFLCFNTAFLSRPAVGLFPERRGRQQPVGRPGPQRNAVGSRPERADQPLRGAPASSPPPAGLQPASSLPPARPDIIMLSRQCIAKIL